MNYLDLFSGIGGFALGAYNSGFRCDNHLFSEIDNFCVKLYQKRFPDSISLGDIKNIDGKELVNKYGNEWIIAGGFPCQDISIAGKSEGLEGKRSGLWFEYWRLSRDLRPKFVIIENVPALTIRGLDRVIAGLTEIGYSAEWQTISASFVGSPQTRKRIYIVSYPDSLKHVKGSKPQAIFQEQALQEKYSGVFKKYRDRSDLPESRFYRKSDGIPRKVDRLKSLGNSIIPQIAEMIFTRLNELTEV